MNEEKLKEFIRLIDSALEIMEDRYWELKNHDFYQKAIEAGWMTKTDIENGYWYIRKKYEYIYNDHFFLWVYFVLKSFKKECENKKIFEKIKDKPKGKRGGGIITRGMGEYMPKIWGEELYDDAIYNACGDVEDYYNHKLE
ncbi:MAG: hypothetical protein CNLJKLNK_01312 [Holosporales bacterium]